MVLNYLLTIGIVGAIVIGGKRYYDTNIKGKVFDDFTEEENKRADFDMIVREINAEFSRMTKRNINDDRLTREELEKKRKHVATLRDNLERAGFGDTNAKLYVKNYIKDILVANNKIQVSEENINDIFPFDDVDKLTPNDRFRTVLYPYTQKYGADGFSKMAAPSEWDLIKKQKIAGDEYYIITRDQIKLIYKCLYETDSFKRKEMGLVASADLGIVTLTYEDKLEILAQKVFEKSQGLGIVDLLNELNIDEIDGGVSGIPSGGITSKTKAKNTTYSWESIWIMVSGINVHLECCSFESQAELERICNNIYKYEPTEVLSKQSGKIGGTTIDGSRINVARPPFSDSYQFYLRKFDSAPSVAPVKLIRDKNKVIPIVMMYWVIKGQRNTAITGCQGCGKTTWLKSVIRFIPTEFNLRIQELMGELNLRYTYPLRNISAFQETETVSEQEGLNFQKKTNGAVNILGEIANAVQASHVIQTAMVASLFAMFTNHAKTAEDLVEAISNNLLEMGLYKDKKDAVAMTVKVLNIDCHLDKIRKDRFIDRISEIIPVSAVKYPSQKMETVDKLSYLAKKQELHSFDEADAEIARELGIKANEEISERLKLALADMPEYFHRVTDPELYSTRELVKRYPIIEDGHEKFDENGHALGEFKLVNLPSEKMMEEIKSKLQYDEIAVFENDMKMLALVSEKGEDAEEVREWVQKKLQQAS